LAQGLAWVRSATMYNPLGSFVAAPGTYTSFPAMPQTGYPQFRPTTFVGAPPMGSFVGAPQMGSFISAAPRPMTTTTVAAPGMSGSPGRFQPAMGTVQMDMGSFVAPPLPAMPAVTTAPTIMRDLGSFVAPPMSGLMDLGSFVAPPMTTRPALPIARSVTYATPATMTAGDESAYRYCPECGAENPSKAKCCMECGSKMGDATAYTDVRPAARTVTTVAAPNIYATATFGQVRMGSMTAPPMATTYGTMPTAMYTSTRNSSTNSPSKPAAISYSQEAENVTGVDI